MAKTKPIENKGLPLAALVAHGRNYQKHPESQIADLQESLRQFQQVRSIVVQANGGKHFTILAGHGIVEAAKREGYKELRADVVPASWSKTKALAYLSADNEIARHGDPDQDQLAAIVRDVMEAEGEALARLAAGEQSALDALLAQGNGSGNITTEQAHQTLAEKFIVPPFSVLDARQGYWQERKRAWIAIGIESELGRGENFQGLSDSNDEYAYNKKAYLARKPNATVGGAPLEAAHLVNGHTVRGDGKGRPLARTFGSGKPGDLGAQYKNGNGLLGESEQARSHYKENGKGKRLTWVPGERPEEQLDETSRKILAAGRRTHGRELHDHEWQRDVLGDVQSPQTGTSIFDPVLCELAYRWFCPPEAIILDPFAGGSVRGIVAERLGYHYLGIDLRPEQIDANRKQAQRLDLNPTWIVGDSRNLAQLVDKPVDFVFSCPPYFDLELYSEDERDLSNAGEYRKFIEGYRAIVAQAVALLKQDRFACFVVGDIRDKKGFYRNFVSDTIAAFQDAGATLYNEAILVTAVGSLPIRISKQFGSYRKLGKTHQNVLVFYKGDIKKIPAAYGVIEVSDPAANYGEIA